MRREHNGILILEEIGERIFPIGFEGIIVTKWFADVIGIFSGRFSNDSGEYIMKPIVEIRENELTSLKNLIKTIEEEAPAEVEMGFPEIAITEEVKELLNN